MNDRQLNFFIITAEEKSFGRAANRLPISLSALSRQIQSLEEELDTLLFTRAASGLELTPAGETLLRHAQNLRTQFALVRNDVHRAGAALLGELDVGGFGSAMLNHIPQIIKRFRDAHPSVNVALLTAPITQQFEDLQQGRTLISFDRLFAAPPELAVELVCMDSMCLALYASHPLARFPAVRFSDLRDEPMIGRHHEKNMPSEYSTLLNHYGFELRIVQKVQDMLTAVAMVGSGLGLALVPSSLRALPMPNVVYRTLLTDKELPCNLYCYYRKAESSPVLNAMLKTVYAYRAESQQRRLCEATHLLSEN